ncbi:MAG: peptide chain release factor N(5)-glutamine methyltransferase [Planctomycetota bacterium]|nr:peptide chain release factor N(5)-glutamine methyltransferase [Planctomycetota bacterium]
MKDVTSVKPEPWTTRRLLDWIGGHLEQQGVHNPTLVARMLLVYVLGGTDIDLFTDPDRPANPSELDQLRPLVSRAAAQEPVQYLVGRADFFGRSFRVNPSTLIPRTATESLIQVVLDWYRGQSGAGLGSRCLRIADLGTGSGCIGITLARQIPDASILATDVVAAALDLARENAIEQGVSDRVEFLSGSLLEPLGGHTVDVLCGNLPYVPDATWAGLDPNVRAYEPESALRAGQDGLDLVRPVIAGATDVLRPGGLLVLEIDPVQAAVVLELARSQPALTSARIERDEFKDERILCATVNLPVS